VNLGEALVCRRLFLSSELPHSKNGGRSIDCSLLLRLAVAKLQSRLGSGIDKSIGKTKFLGFHAPRYTVIPQFSSFSVRHEQFEGRDTTYHCEE